MLLKTLRKCLLADNGRVEIGRQQWCQEKVCSVQDALCSLQSPVQNSLERILRGGVLVQVINRLEIPHQPPFLPGILDIEVRSHCCRGVLDVDRTGLRFPDPLFWKKKRAQAEQEQERIGATSKKCQGVLDIQMRRFQSLPDTIFARTPIAIVSPLIICVTCRDPKVRYRRFGLQCGLSRP